MKNLDLTKKYRHVNEIDISADMWQTLAIADKPIVMYGMGNGADKILTVFSDYGIEVADFFASDGFVRHQLFHGKTVMSYSEICEKYDDFIIVVSFGSRLPEVLAKIYELSEKHELYAPDVPVVGGSDIFDLEYFKKHRQELSQVCELFSDDFSRKVFCDVILYKLTGKIDYLRRHTVSTDEVMGKILNCAEYEYTADLGAYNGDSISELLHYAEKLKAVTALEPDLKNYRKLTNYADTVDIKINACNCAAWNKIETLTFTQGGNRNSTLISTEGEKTGAKLKKIAAAALDSLYMGRCDYIKYDVEGAEYEAIEGSKATIEREKPELLVSMYHKSEDLFRLPILVHELGYRKLYLRRYEYVPAWDLNLLAIF